MLSEKTLEDNWETQGQCHHRPQPTGRPSPGTSHKGSTRSDTVFPQYSVTFFFFSVCLLSLTPLHPSTPLQYRLCVRHLSFRVSTISTEDPKTFRVPKSHRSNRRGTPSLQCRPVPSVGGGSRGRSLMVRRCHSLDSRRL